MPDTLLPRDGLVIVAKRDCPTCVLVEPVMQSLDRAGPLAVVTLASAPEYKIIGVRRGAAGEAESHDADIDISYIIESFLIYESHVRRSHSVRIG